jgi:Chitobiase/beta-hexosaminidase C-terminal domain
VNAFIKNLPLGRNLMLAALGCLLTLSARAATSVSHFGITWTFSADRPTGTFVNGEPWVVGPVTITNINPNPSQSTYNVQNGSMINPVPNTNHGFDSNPACYPVQYEPAKNVALSFPFTLKVGDVLVSAKSQAYYPTWLKTVCALTVLSGPPPSGSFRPSIFGTDRSVRWNVSQMDWSVLKNYAATSSTPTKASIEAQIPPLPWFEWLPAWNGNSLQADDNTTDLPFVDGTHYRVYGRETAQKFGRIGLWLNTNQPLADKQAIAIQMVQNGMDIYDYVRLGGGYYHDGGHKCGRKLPLVLAAMMLNDPSLKAMAGNPDIFQEDTQVWFVNQSDVGRVLWVAPPGDSWYGREFLQYTQADVGMPEWGIRHRFEPVQDNRSWSATYRSTVGNGMMGSWLAAHLMGMQSIWNHPAAFSYMERYHTLSGDGETFAAEMYAAHKLGGTVTPPPPQSAVNPVITPASGYFDTAQSVTISTTTPSATIRYTLNGVTPGTTDPIYSGPISVTSTKTIKAIAYATGLNPSGVTTADLTFSATPPSFSPAPGAYSVAQSVALSSTTSGATIRYTTDGSDPTASSPVYANPISVAASATIKAITIKSGIATSPITTGNYVIGAFVGTTTWASVAFSPQTAAFTYRFDMAASANNIDSVVGLGGVTPVTGYGDLACMVRFNSSGKIDARNGGAYAALADLPYSVGNVYSVIITVNPGAKTYDVTVSVNGGAAVQIAQDYAFRTEQASLASFNSMSLIAISGSQTVTNNGLVAGGPQAPQGLRVIGP